MPTEAEQIRYIDGEGTRHFITDNPNIQLLFGMKGYYFPPVVNRSDKIPKHAGRVHRGMDYDQRFVTLPFIVKNYDRASLWPMIQHVAGWFNPELGEGKIEVVDPSGNIKLLNVVYNSGLEGEITADTTGEFWQRFMVELIAHDPFWYDAVPTIRTFTTGGTSQSFFPFFPMRLSSSTVLQTITETNDGDVEAWPIWTITGPGNTIIIRNLTTGKNLVLNETLAAGESIVVDTRPRIKTATRNTGASVFPQSGSSFFPFIRGVNQLQIEMNLASVGSSVTLEYTKRRLVM